eukprot:7383085-Prymnesium_polylepis.1
MDVRPSWAAGRAAWRAGMWSAARRGPWPTRMEPPPVPVHAGGQGAMAGPTRKAWPAPTRMPPLLAEAAH